jgi:phosphonate transport system permease protein
MRRALNLKTGSPQHKVYVAVNQTAHVSEHYWRQERVLNLKRLLLWTAIVLVLVISWRAAEIRPTALFEPGALGSVLAFLRGLFPPDLSPSFLRVVGAAALQTLAIAVAGTALSIVISMPLGMLATATLWQRGILLAGERPGASKLFLAGLSRAARAFLGFLRAVPDLVWGLLFVVAVGLGSLAGTLALAVSYAGVLGRVYADVFEDVDQHALEALHATGATRTQVFLFAIWPQAAASITAYTLYSFECCVRAASVLGFIGAGGIGYEIYISMRLFEYGQVLTLMLTLVGLVAAADAASRFIRRRLHANAPAGSLAHQRIADEENARPRRAFTPQLKKGVTLVVVAIVVAVSFYFTGFLDLVSADSGALTRSARFVVKMFPPELDPVFLRSLGVPLVQTIGISVMGTLIGVVIGAALALPATSTVVLGEEDESARGSLLERSARRVVYYSVRLVLNILRSIPELVWVLVCVLAVGLGPFAGTLAIGLHTGGVLGKLYAETLEEVPARPIEALRAAGARPLQILVWGVWPQARATLVSYTVLRWDFNLRVSTVLGLVGGGGLGLLIYNNVQLGFYSRVTTLIAVVYSLVLTTNWVGDRLRLQAKCDH